MRVDLENRCQSLSEELEFRKSMFEEVRSVFVKGNDMSTGLLLIMVDLLISLSECQCTNGIDNQSVLNFVCLIEE